MQRTMLKSKIHRATVTHADLEYEGSVTIDSLLLDAADIWENEQVCIWNVTSGARFETYALRGAPGSGLVCVNGAAAHHAHPGDLVIIASWLRMTEKEARRHTPKLVFVDRQNRIKPLDRAEIPGPMRPDDRLDA
ncbi:MAG: aspartate 1-decarboxylase [Myxococcales bacterium]|nr:MAG: aspartate 1-decarboxylase [Myxococcales bacterium]